MEGKRTCDRSDLGADFPHSSSSSHMDSLSNSPVGGKKKKKKNTGPHSSE